MRPFIAGLVLFASLTSSTSHAAYFQSPVNDAKLGPLQIHTETGQMNLLNLVEPNKSVLLVPAYFSCNSTCPLMTESLRDAFSELKEKSNVSVIILSFNQNDGPDEIKMFRAHHSLPAQWTLAVADHEAEAKELLNPLGYQFQKTNNGFDHPNSAFIFSPKKKEWSGVLAGIDNKPFDIQKALYDAERFDDENLNHSYIRYFRKPEYLIVIGFIGLFVALTTIIFILVRRNKKVSVDPNTITCLN